MFVCFCFSVQWDETFSARADEREGKKNAKKNKQPKIRIKLDAIKLLIWFRSFLRVFFFFIRRLKSSWSVCPLLCLLRGERIRFSEGAYLCTTPASTERFTPLRCDLGCEDGDDRERRSTHRRVADALWPQQPPPPSRVIFMIFAICSARVFFSFLIFFFIKLQGCVQGRSWTWSRPARTLHRSWPNQPAAERCPGSKKTKWRWSRGGSDRGTLIASDGDHGFPSAATFPVQELNGAEILCAADCNVREDNLLEGRSLLGRGKLRRRRTYGFFSDLDGEVKTSTVELDGCYPARRGWWGFRTFIFTDRSGSNTRLLCLNSLN